MLTIWIMDNVECGQNKKERAPTPSIPNDDVTGDAHNDITLLIPQNNVKSIVFICERMWPRGVP